MTTHPYDTLTLASGAKLFFTPCPGTQAARLEEAVEQLHQAGAGALITLMPDAEMVRFHAQSLPTACAALGMDWFHLPIGNEERPGPQFEQNWSDARHELKTRLAADESIAVHCRGGSGRTGLMIGILLVDQGMPLAEAIRMVQSIRPTALENPDQLSFLQECLAS